MCDSIAEQEILFEEEIRGFPHRVQLPSTFLTCEETADQVLNYLDALSDGVDFVSPRFAVGKYEYLDDWIFFRRASDALLFKLSI